jgi:UDP-glucose 4-epimerase
VNGPLEYITPNMRPAQILILGGGFIGSSLADRLAKQGEKVVMLSRSALLRPIAGVEWRQGRLDDHSHLNELLPRSKALVFTATTSTPGRFQREPAREAEENLVPLLRMLEAVQEHPHIHLLYLSSGGALYGNPQNLPVVEDTTPAPLSYHAAGKAAAEHFLDVFAHQGYAVTVMRPSNVYGPGQIRKPGFGVVLTILEHIRNETPMEIWGDGETVRDYIYIDDLTHACMLALAATNAATYNIGSGEGCSIKALCRLAKQVTGQTLEIHHHPARDVDVKAIILDNTSFRTRYGWQPEVSLEQGLRNTWNWLLLHNRTTLR